MVRGDPALGATGCFAEVFILRGLHEGYFVSVVDTGVAGADLAKMCVIVKNGVDSIGVTGGDVWFCGSADSKGVAGF